MKRICKMFTFFSDRDLTRQLTALDYLLFNGWVIERVDSVPIAEGSKGAVMLNYIISGDVDDDTKSSSTWEDIFKSLREKRTVQTVADIQM